ncbi:MAG: hypothetical protein LUC34_04530 [Campylobacter sp.]|nr:hypothetical protein [Campylobacter sp.]
MGYIGATLREEPGKFRTSKTASDHLPAFMKSAKNREAIIKILKDMQDNL